MCCCIPPLLLAAPSRSEKRATARTPFQHSLVLLVLTGCAPVTAWPLDWCRFVLAPVLYSSGAFANVMGGCCSSPAMVQGSLAQLETEPVAGRRGRPASILAQRQTRRYMRSVQTKCAHVVYIFIAVAISSSPGPGPGFVLGVRPEVRDLPAREGSPPIVVGNADFFAPPAPSFKTR